MEQDKFKNADATTNAQTDQKLEAASRFREELNASQSIRRTADAALSQGSSMRTAEGSSSWSSRDTQDQILRNSIESVVQGSDSKTTSGDSPVNSMKERSSFGDSISKCVEAVKITDADRAEAKKKLDGTLSDLIPEGDRKTLSAIHNALVDGDVNALSKAVQSFKGQPEKLKAFMNEVEKSLKREGASAHVAVSKEGKVLLYENHGSTAVELGADGSVGVRPISTKFDGTAVLEPGEVLNKEPADCMKEVGDAVARSLAHKKNAIIDIGREWPMPKPLPSIERKPYPFPDHKPSPYELLPYEKLPYDEPKPGRKPYDWLPESPDNSKPRFLPKIEPNFVPLEQKPRILPEFDKNDK